jgi:DNA replication protein DnaC
MRHISDIVRDKDGYVETMGGRTLGAFLRREMELWPTLPATEQKRRKQESEREKSKRRSTLTPETYAKLQVEKHFGLHYGASNWEWCDANNNVDAISAVIRYLRNIHQNINSGSGLILTGDRCSGKTCMLALMAQKMYAIPNNNQGYPGPRYKIQFTSHEALNDELCDYRNYSQPKESKFGTADILILDDFVSEIKPTDRALSKFYALMEYRNANYLPVIASTTKSEEWLLSSHNPYLRTVLHWQESNGLFVPIVRREQAVSIAN